LKDTATLVLVLSTLDVTGRANFVPLYSIASFPP